MRTIVKMRFGSHVYGTNLPTSDLDFKAVHVPSADDILLQRVKPAISQKTNNTTQRNTADDVDVESFALQRFMELLLQGQTGPMDMLFTPDRWIVEGSDLWDRIRAERQHWISSGVVAFIGYCRQQAAKYGVRGGRVATVRAALEAIDALIDMGVDPATRLKDDWAAFDHFATSHEHAAIVLATHAIEGREVPTRYLEVCGRKVQDHMSLKHARQIFQTVFDAYGVRALQAERNEGIDFKALMHAVRVCNEAEELLLHHTITFPRPNAKQLIKVRKGEIPYKAVAEILEAGMERLTECQGISTLPAEPNHERAAALVREAYREAVVAS